MRIVAKESLGSKGAALQVTGEIADGRDATPDMLELHVPGLVGTKGPQRFFGQRGVQLGMVGLKSSLDSTAEPSRERLVVNQKIVFGGVVELIGFLIESDGGDDAVHVGMVLHLPSPGMQHADAATAVTPGFGGNDVGQGRSAFTQQEVVEFFGVAKAGDAEFCRDGEGDQKVRDGQQLGFLSGAPELLIGGSALRAAAMIATVVGEVGLLTVATAVESSSQFGSTAREGASHRSVMSGVEA